MTRKIHLLFLPALLLISVLLSGCGGNFIDRTAEPVAGGMMTASRSASPVPTSCFIQGVPYYQQLQAHGCGAASLQMVLDYWGPYIDQKEVYNAARTNKGTAVPDIARAAQFSSLSMPAGNFYPGAVGAGYTGRSLGYAGFFYASTGPWLDQLKAVVAQGYPVVVLTDWLPGAYGPHYRVITGYDDAGGVIILNDPWAREFKHVCGVNGSAQPVSVNKTGKGEFEGWKWSYADFLAVWQLSATDWGIPGLAYGAVIAVPWQVEVEAPSSVMAGQTFDVSVRITYPCPAPFSSSSFPKHPASQASLAVDLPAGLTLDGGQPTVPLADLQAGQTVTVTLRLKAGQAPGACELGVTASGLISGLLEAWRNYPAYTYTDRIGGAGAATIDIR